MDQCRKERRKEGRKKVMSMEHLWNDTDKEIPK
jgi:hypothetical protein